MSCESPRAERLGEREKRQAAPRRPKHSEPGGAIAQVMQGLQQRHEVPDNRDIPQWHEVHADGVDADCSECGHDGVARACARATSTATVASAEASRIASDAIRDERRLSLSISIREETQADELLVSRRARRKARRERDGARPNIVGGRKKPREERIGPRDQRRRRAEVPRELQRLHRHFADAMLASAQEQPDLRFAKEVNRLHRIAYREQRVTVALLPRRGERGKQVELRDRGVLELVDEHVPERDAGAQSEIGRQSILNERLLRRREKRRCSRLSPRVRTQPAVLRQPDEEPGRAPRSPPRLRRTACRREAP